MSLFSFEDFDKLIFFMNCLEIVKDIFEIIGTIATVSIAILVYFAQKQRDSFDKNLQKPVLDFIRVKNKNWVLMNIGKGPALFVRFIEKDPSGTWRTPIIGYSIPSEMVLDISQETSTAQALAAVYKDLAGKNYMVYCVDDTCKVIEEANWNSEQRELNRRIHDNPRSSQNLLLMNYEMS
ncbi:hypothetical protein [Pinibacter soli]|uniref:Uncharacterized protein n=1 Tax=Pinibacter soli TaxID=3044211 RepID=A0ABT6RDK1_9BACT|nr:hypothetical protein [Pinibacter soli]MDI3320481.1 hypothetical protein [Pinibacter soli]